MWIALIALAVSIGLVVSLLLRQRERTRLPEDQPQAPTSKPRNRQERILAKLEPLPEIPSIMDLVAEEIREHQVDQIPGHEGLDPPVMLKVFRRDEQVRDRCTHNGIAFVIGDGVAAADAGEEDVKLFCEQCGDLAEATEAGTEPGVETLEEE